MSAVLTTVDNECLKDSLSNDHGSGDDYDCTLAKWCLLQQRKTKTLNTTYLSAWSERKKTPADSERHDCMPL